FTSSSILICKLGNIQINSFTDPTTKRSISGKKRSPRQFQANNNSQITKRANFPLSPSSDSAQENPVEDECDVKMTNSKNQSNSIDENPTSSNLRINQPHLVHTPTNSSNDFIE